VQFAPRAVSFFLLAPYLVIQSVHDLATGHAAETTVLGIVLTAASVVVMPGLGIAKRHLGASLGSRATLGEGVQNLICAARAAAVLDRTRRHRRVWVDLGRPGCRALARRLGDP
jgi:divalent metal cation (Fe/Co/Zn/Cd) transporter